MAYKKKENKIGFMEKPGTEGWRLDFSKQLKYCRRLPTLPAIALQLVELADNPSASLDQFADLVTQDPALACKLLRVANSSFYGQRRKISRLSQAVGLLGLNTTITLSLSFSLRRSLSEWTASGFDVIGYWRRCLLTALAAQTIAIELHEAHPEEFLLAGLLQDIGILVMHAMHEETYASLYAKSMNHGQLLKKESATFGYNHAQAGACLLQEWHLPGRIASSVQLSHNTASFSHGRKAGAVILPKCVATAAMIADAWIQGATSEAFEVASEPLDTWLDVDLERYQHIIATMSRQMPEMETLFDAELVASYLVEGAEESAKEILLIRNLQQLQTTIDTDARTNALESRAAALEEYARLDAMTGMFNRFYMECVLEREFNRATAGWSPLSVAFIDVDRFKEINDAFGHASGDQVLIMIGRRLMSSVRQIDTVARYGGEEFVALLPNTGMQDAQVVMERVLSSIRDSPFFIRNQNLTLTVSIGIATHREGNRTFNTVWDLLEAADSALYMAKKEGRERIILNDPGDELLLHG